MLEERISSSPGVPLISRSSGTVISCSTSSAARPGNLRRHLRRDIAELRVRFDRQGLPGIDAVAGQQHGQNDDRDAPLQAEADELINH